MASEPARRADRSRPDCSPTSDFGLGWHVGDVFVERARSVVARGCVLTCAEVGAGELHAMVSGTRSWPYEVTVSYQLTGDRVGYFEGECDCPVELDCKHAVAALLYYLTVSGSRRPTGSVVHAAPVRPAAWEGSLTDLLGPPDDPMESAGNRAPLALQLSPTVRPTVGPFGSAGLRIRPLVRNERNRWVSSGVSWRDLRYQHTASRHWPEHLESLRAIADLELGRRPYQTLDTWIGVDGPDGSRIWNALIEAHQAGVVFVLERSNTIVGLSGEAPEVALDLTRDPDLRLRPVIRMGEHAVSPTARLVGQPAQALLLGYSAEGDPIASPTLARLRRPLTAELTALLTTGPIDIPEPDEPRFFAEFLPPLRRRVAVLSTDGSVDIPEPVPPRPVLVVTRHPEHRIGLHWQWQDESGRRRDLDDRRGLATDERTDLARAVRSVLAHDVLPADALTAGPDGLQPRSHHLLDGADSVRFMTTAWPVLAKAPDLITELGGPEAGLRYRPADSPPELDVRSPTEPVGGPDGAGDHAVPHTADWFGLSVRVTVDGENVPFELIFRALAGEDSMIILPSGTYLDAADLDERWNSLRELIEEARAMDDAGPGELRIDRYTTSRWDDLESSGLLNARAGQWRDRVRALAPDSAGPSSTDPESEPASGHAVPDGLRADLRDYQRAGVDWLRERYDRGLGGILADDMGLGKTVQMLGLIAHARSADPDGPPLIVVAPTSVVANWVAEAARFTPELRVVAVTQGAARRGTTLAAAIGTADLVVTSYQLFRLGNDEFRERPWAALILDEAQFVKNMQSKGFRCAHDFPAPVSFAVTGTPLENNLMEFWALLAIATPGLFPESRRFTEHYRIPIERGETPDRLAQLRRRVAPFVLRRTKEQVAPELPAKLEQVIELDLSPRHRQVYQRHLQRERQRILGLLRDERSLVDHRFQILRSLTLLRQLSLDPSLVDEAYQDIPSSKLEAVIDRIDEIVGAGHRVLVFSQFTRFLARTRDQLDRLGIAHCLLDGRTKDRAGVVEAFRSGAAPVFLISLKAGGFGLNLTEADYCILLDPWWNPAAENQAVDRAHRIGQTRTVIVHRYVARGTVEEKVMALKAGKAKLFDDVLGADPAGRSGGATLTAEEIRELLT